MQAPAGLAWREARADARATAMGRNPLLVLAAMTGVADAAAMFGMSLVAFVARHGIGPIPLEIMLATLLGAALGINALYVSGAYALQSKSSLAVQTGRAIQAWTAAFVALIIAGYLAKVTDEYSRIWAVTWYVLAAAGLVTIRVVAAVERRRLRSRGRLASTIAIVDLCGAGDAFAQKFRRGDADARLLGVFAPGPSGSADAAPSPVMPGPVMSNPVMPSQTGRQLDDLIVLSGLFRIDDVFVLVSGETTANVSAVLRRLGTIPTNVRLCPIMPEVEQTPIRDAVILHECPVMTVHHRPLGGWSSMVKRIEDIGIGLIAAVVLAPVMAAIGVLVWLDSPGPILFRQARQGFNNNVITVLKFRTMTHREEPETDVPQATRHDARVTRLGHILRRTSLDELPQIFNVLRGDMSLVGPRPHAVAHNQHYARLIDDYLGRHRVQPGITGWAQVNGFRGQTETLDKMQRRVEYDLAYIDNWSVLFDLQIILMTAICIAFDRKGAY